MFEHLFIVIFVLCRIYEHQRKGEAFTTVNNLLQSMTPSMLDKLHHSIKDELKARGFSKDFIAQLVMGGMRSNYGQTTSIHAFVGKH